jgi:putative aldouronate transport system substrate-binding protein
LYVGSARAKVEAKGTKAQRKEKNAMKQLTKHASALLLAVMLAAALLGGCTSAPAAQTQAPTQAPSTAAEATSAPAATSLPFGDGTTLSLSCYEGWYAAVSMADNLPVWQEFEKRTGVKIKWEVYSDYETAMNPRIASGKNLPDIMLVTPTWTNSGVYKLGTEGIIIPLDDLIANDAPDIQNVFKGDPSLKALLTAPDGKIYTIAETSMYVDNVVASSFFIRQDWLDKLNLQVPTTTDEWETVLKAFKDNDPNGNGKPDELPYVGYDGVFNGLSYFGSAFGLTSPTTPWWYDENGKVYCEYATQNYKELLTYLNKLYSEGLIDKDFSRDEANFLSLLSTNTVGSFETLCGYLTQNDNVLKSANIAGSHALVAPPSGPNGLKLLKRGSTSNHYGITRDCKTPDIAMKWINYVWGTDEGVRLNEFGLEGKTYTIGSDGNPHFTDFVLHNPDNLDPYNALRSLGAANSLLNRTPMSVYIEMQKGTKNLPFEESLTPYRLAAFPSIMGLPEEQSVLDTVLPDFNSYVEEMQIKFMTGTEPLSGFDSYLETLNKIGLDKLLAVYQAQYDRVKGK